MNARPVGPGDDASALVTGRVDGRRLRSERTRQLIIEAYIALVREHHQVPTAAQIAERAGYSVRSVFERFPDLLALRVAAADYAIAEARAQGALRDIDGDRTARIRSQVEARARGCERWLPLWRALNANLGESEELKKRLHLIRDLIRLRVELMFKPELSTLAEPHRRHLLVAIEAITDYESWGRMRELYGLSVEDACGVWIRALDRLLPSTPAVS
jgi:AcrR family transcriptional regulator